MSKIYRVLGLDPSFACTGWGAGSTDGTLPAHGCFARIEGVNASRLAAFRDSLLRLQDRYRVGYVYFEEVRVIPVGMKTAASESARFMLEGAIYTIAAEMDCLAVPVAPATMRNFFIGVGSTPKWMKATNTDWLKEKAVSMANRHGWTCTNHNEAEGLGFMAFGLARLSPEYAARMAVELMGRRIAPALP